MRFFRVGQTSHFIDLGSSPGFSGHFPKHFAALRAKAKDRFARAAPTPPAALASRFSFAFARQRGEVSHNRM